MDRDFEPNRTTDYDFHKARALVLREQEIDRLFRRLVEWLRAPFDTSGRTNASPPLRSGKSARRQPPKLGLRGARDAHC